MNNESPAPIGDEREIYAMTADHERELAIRHALRGIDIKRVVRRVDALILKAEQRGYDRAKAEDAEARAIAAVVNDASDELGDAVDRKLSVLYAHDEILTDAEIICRTIVEFAQKRMEGVICKCGHAEARHVERSPIASLGDTHWCVMPILGGAARCSCRRFEECTTPEKPL